MPRANHKFSGPQIARKQSRISAGCLFFTYTKRSAAAPDILHSRRGQPGHDSSFLMLLNVLKMFSAEVNEAKF